MKKTININLAGQVFTIDEDAYNKLSQYLDTITHYYASSPDKDEIVHDIELSIAEDFSHRTTPGKQSISLPDVSAVIEKLGTVSDIAHDESNESESVEPKNENEQKTSRRFYRNPDDTVFGGVASGIGAFFDIDPLFIRLAFVILTLAWGFSIVIYVILWIITPKATTPSEKAAMKGEPLTLKEIEAQVKEVVHEGKEQLQKAANNPNLKKLENKAKSGFHRLGYFFTTILQHTFRTIMVFGKFILSLAGFFIVLAACIAIIALMVIGTNTLLNRHSPLIDAPFLRSLPTIEISLLVISGGIVILIPLILLIQSGITLIKKKNIFRLSTLFIILFFWGVAVAVLIYSTVRVAPDIEKLQAAKQADQTTREYPVQEFSSLTLHGSFIVEIIPGDTVHVSATGSEESLQRLTIDQIDQQNSELLIIEHDRKRWCIFCHTEPISISITTPILSAVDARGAVRAQIIGFDVPTLQLNAIGASLITFNGETESLDVMLKNASRFFGAGKSDSLTLRGAGSAQFDTTDLTASTVDIHLYENSTAEIVATNTLTGELTGISKVYYHKQKPQTISIETNQASKAIFIQ